jgi:hypothetical protein
MVSQRGSKFPAIVAGLAFGTQPAKERRITLSVDFAIKEFREMKMQPSLERALRQKKILKA